jgi:pSer/pThr/pTyr-binding forkhead associated (FHA) protein
MPKLIVMNGPATTKQISVRANTTTIGRHSTNDVVLDAMQVSRRHAVVTKEGPFVTISDVGSCNGVFVNGTKVRSQVLVGGDEVLIGPFKIRFLSGDHDLSVVDTMRLVTPPDPLSDFDRARETYPARF